MCHSSSQNSHISWDAFKIMLDSASRPHVSYMDQYANKDFTLANENILTFTCHLKWQIICHQVREDYVLCVILKLNSIKHSCNLLLALSKWNSMQGINWGSHADGVFLFFHLKRIFSWYNPRDEWQWEYNATYLWNRTRCFFHVTKSWLKASSTCLVLVAQLKTFSSILSGTFLTREIYV